MLRVATVAAIIATANAGGHAAVDQCQSGKFEITMSGDVTAAQLTALEMHMAEGLSVAGDLPDGAWVNTDAAMSAAEAMTPTCATAWANHTSSSSMPSSGPSRLLFEESDDRDGIFETEDFEDASARSLTSHGASATVHFAYTVIAPGASVDAITNTTFVDAVNAELQGDSTLSFEITGASLTIVEAAAARPSSSPSPTPGPDTTSFASRTAWWSSLSLLAAVANFA